MEPSCDDKKGEGVTLEIRNSQGEVLQERELTQQEVEVMPELMKVRELLAKGDPHLALSTLVGIVGRTQGLHQFRVESI